MTGESGFFGLLQATTHPSLGHAVIAGLGGPDSGTTALQGKSVPPDRAHRFLVDLESRFTEAGQADPAIIESMLAELRDEAGS